MPFHFCHAKLFSSKSLARGTEAHRLVVNRKIIKLDLCKSIIVCRAHPRTLNKTKQNKTPAHRSKGMQCSVCVKRTEKNAASERLAFGYLSFISATHHKFPPSALLPVRLMHTLFSIHLAFARMCALYTVYVCKIDSHSRWEIRFQTKTKHHKFITWKRIDFVCLESAPCSNKKNNANL